MITAEQIQPLSRGVCGIAAEEVLTVENIQKPLAYPFFKRTTGPECNDLPQVVEPVHLLPGHWGFLAVRVLQGMG